MLAKDKSFTYSCGNRALLEKIEAGIHALLSKYPYFHGSDIRNGSSEWFCGTSFELAIQTIEIFVKADIGLSTSNLLIDVLNAPINYQLQIDHYKNIEAFFKSHNTCIQYIDSIINNSKPNISVTKTDGFYVLENLKISNDFPPTPLKYQWFKIIAGKLFLDIKTMNRWKIEATNREIFNLISLKYFDASSLRGINSIFDKDKNLVTWNPVKIKHV